MAESDLQSLSCIIDGIYKAGMSPSPAAEWKKFLDKLSHLMEGSLMCLHLHDTAASKPLGLLSSQIDPVFLEDYTQNYGRHNMWAEPMLRAPIGRVMHTDEILPTEDLLKTRYYNEYLVRENFIAAVAVNIRKSSSVGIYFSGNLRASNAQDVAPRMALLFELLGPHIARSFDIMRSLNIGLANGHLLDAIERSHDAVFLLDRAGRLSHENPVGAAVRAAGQLLAADTSGRLTFLDKSAQTCFRRDLESILKNDLSRPDIRGFTAASLSGSRCRGIVSPVPYDDEQIVLSYTFDTHPTFMLTLSGGAIVSSNLAHLARFSLTPAEIALALAIAGGASPHEYATTRGTSVHTVRSQLKSIFAKTGTTRQSQLGALIRR